MKKQVIILTVIFTLGLLYLNNNTSVVREKDTSPLLQTYNSQSIDIQNKSKDVNLVSANSSPTKTLEQEIAQLKNELNGIDVEKELNSLDTSSQRREFIISKMNLYAKKMGLLAKIEIAMMKKEIEL